MRKIEKKIQNQRTLRMNENRIMGDYNNVLCDFFNNWQDRCHLLRNTILGEFTAQIFHLNGHKKKLSQIKM